MTLRQYLIWMLLMTGLSWIGWWAVVSIVDPGGSGALGLALFYATLALSLIGTFAIVGLAGRAWIRKHEPVSRHASTAFRQSILLTGLVVGSLALQSRSLLTWWNLLLFIATLTFLEFFLVSARSGR